ncbi:hypothetical protein, partial [Thermogemmatispora sp.]|uniref:hypothetical protein n=1 Tax=Thermogemmatispora sp. TaxID=1968838 RepID=UPI0035E44217
SSSENLSLGVGAYLIHVWDPSSERLLHCWRAFFSDSLVWSPDGSLLAFSGPQSLEIRSVLTGQLLLQLPLATPCAWSPDGSLLVSSSDFSVDLWPVGRFLAAWQASPT